MGIELKRKELVFNSEVLSTRIRQFRDCRPIPQREIARYAEIIKWKMRRSGGTATPAEILRYRKKMAIQRSDDGITFIMILKDLLVFVEEYEDRFLVADLDCRSHPVMESVQMLRPYIGRLEKLMVSTSCRVALQLVPNMTAASGLSVDCRLLVLKGDRVRFDKTVSGVPLERKGLH